MISPTSKTAEPTPSKLAIPRRIIRQRDEGLNVTTCEHSEIREFHISAKRFRGETGSNLFRRLAFFLKERGAVIVRQEIFGRVDLNEPVERLLLDLFGEINWPLNWIDGNSGENDIAGTHLLAISGANVESISLHGKTIATVFEDKWAKHCLMGNIGPADACSSQSAQTENTYELFQNGLAAAGMNIGDVVRTWFFLDDILSWYGEFNKVRNRFYAGQDLRGKTFPASTGVSGKNPNGAAISLAAWAMQPLHSDTYFTEVTSPLQCPAPNYGSGFSRAAEMVTPEYRRMFVSGTASISSDGSSAHEGDITKQIQLSMDVVLGILQSRDLTFADVTRATLYFKDISQAGVFGTWCAERNITLPAVATQADVCRDELLFEIELDAFATIPQIAR